MPTETESKSTQAEADGNGHGSDSTFNEAPLAKTTTSTGDAQYLEGIRLFATVGGLFLAALCVSLDRTILSTAIPQITTEFSSLSDVGWYGSSYLLTSACFMLSFGKLYSEFNIKWIFLTVVAIFEVGSIICAAAPSSPVLIVGRAIAGLGSAGVTNGAFTILAASLPLHKRPKYTGAISAAMGICQMVGPTLGGVFASHVTWRWCFWINLPLGGITIPVVFFFLQLPDKKKEKKTEDGKESPAGPTFIQRLDLLGTIFLIPSTVCLLLALQWGGSEYEWSSWRIIVLLTIFAVTFVIWVAVQIFEGDAVATLPMFIVRNRSIAAALFYTMTLMSMSFLMSYFLPIWFQVVRDASAIKSGVNLLAMTGPASAMSLSVGFITSAIGYYVPMLMGGTVFASTACGLISRFGVDTTTGYWAGSLVILGLGTGMGMQPTVLIPQVELTGRNIALGVSAIIFVQTISGAIFLSVGSNLLSSRLLTELQARVPSIDASTVVDYGASPGLRQAMLRLYDESTVQQIIESYAVALRNIFLLALILVCLSILGSSMVQWRNVNAGKKAVAKPKDPEKPLENTPSSREGRPAEAENQEKQAL